MVFRLSRSEDVHGSELPESPELVPRPLAFFSGLRDFYREFRFQKAGTDDFQRAMERASGRNLGTFFDRVSKFPRIINIGEITIHARSQADAEATVTAECTATTFVLADAGRGGGPGKATAAR